MEARDDARMQRLIRFTPSRKVAKKFTIFCITTEVRCIPHPSWRALDTNITKKDFIPGDAIEYWCQDNFTFDDHSTHKESVCTLNEEWDSPLEDCSGWSVEAMKPYITLSNGLYRLV